MSTSGFERACAVAIVVCFVLSSLTVIDFGKPASHSESPVEIMHAAHPSAEWHFDEGSGQYASDSSGNGNTGTLGSGTGVDGNDPTWVTGMSGTALQFSSSGDKDYVIVADSESLNPSYITVEAWVYPTGYGYYTSFLTKNYYGTWTEPYFEYLLWLMNADPKPGFELTVSGAPVYTGTGSPDSIPMNEWTYLAATYDGAYVKLYVNGVLKGNSTAPNGPIESRPYPLYIGPSSASANHKFDGKIDEVSIWNRSLSAEEILSHYYREQYTPHAPIFINGNSQFTEANGVVGGDGTAGNPYVIAEWNISASSADGIRIWNTNAHFVVRDCYVHDGGIATNKGIYLSNCVNGVLKNNTCTNNSLAIFLDSSSNGITVSNNNCSNNSYGVHVYQSSSSNMINNNLLNSNDMTGIRLGISCTGNNVMNNTCSGNMYGIEIHTSDSNTLVNNTCSLNTQYGIFVVQYSSNNVITKNRVFNNSLYGIIDINYYGNTNNKFWNNTFVGNNDLEVQAFDNGNSNLWYSPGIYHGYGNYWSDWLTPDVAAPWGIVDSPYSIAGPKMSKDNYPLTGAPIVRGQYTPHAPIYINGNSQFSAANGVVGGDGTAADPYVIAEWNISASSADGIRIWNTNAYFIVRSCHVHSGGLSFNGIHLNNTVNGTLSDNHCTDNLRGIYLYSSSNNTISNNNCSSDRYGVHLWTSSNNTVDNNTCSSNAQYGTYLYSSSNGNTLINNTCSKNQRGMYLWTSCNNNTLRDNNCSSNSDRGIHLYSSSNNNTLINNNCSSISDRGIYLHTSENNTINNNTCNSNTQYGVYLYSSRNNTISNNTCGSNGKYGVNFYSSNNNTISRNNCSSNSHSGIYLNSNSDDNTLTGNNFSGNQYGIYLISASDENNISLNQICCNTNHGVYIASGSNNTIWNNTFTGNNGGGIQASDSGKDNRWNIWGTPHGYGNIWSDWQSPDSDYDLIVDNPYGIAGSAGAKDYYPRIELNAHAPIFIDGDSQFTSANGVRSGSGTFPDPYVIEDWDITASAAYGIKIWNTNAYFIVRGCYVHDGGSVCMGIYLYHCKNGTIQDTICLRNQYGIYLASSSGNTLSNNTCQGGYGIYLDGRSNGNIVVNNSCKYNNVGIYIRSSWYNTLANNTCSYGGHGMYLAFDSWGNNISGNTFYYNNFYGVMLEHRCMWNRIWNNSFSYNNHTTGTYIPVRVQARDEGHYNWWNSSGTPHGYGNYWRDWTRPDTAPPFLIVDLPYSIGGPMGAKDYYPRRELRPHAPISINGNVAFMRMASLERWAGDGTETNPYIIQNFDIDSSAMHGIQIQNTNIFFVIRNTTICSSSHNRMGVYLSNVVNARVENMSISGNTYGVYLQYCRNARAVDIYSLSNSYHGVYLRYCADTMMLRLSSSMNGRNGVFGISCEEIEISHSIISLNEQSGVGIDQSVGVNISDSVVLTNEYYGVLLTSCSSSRILASNLSSNGYYGATLKYCVNASVGDAVVLCNDIDGVYLLSCANVSLTDTESLANQRHGVLGVSCTDSVILRCNVSLNVRTGLYLDSCANVSIAHLAAYSNGNCGISLWSCVELNISDGDVIGSSIHGIFANSCTDVVVFEGNVSMNLQNGILATSCTGTSISKLCSSLNALAGIFLVSCENSNVTGSNVSSNSGNGIIFDHCVDASIAENDLWDNWDYGVMLRSSAGMRVYHNNFLDYWMDSPYDDNSIENQWDNGHPSGGNYWASYRGVDANSDGIGDSKYWIDFDSVDNYPLICRYL